MNEDPEKVKAERDQLLRMIFQIDRNEESGTTREVLTLKEISHVYFALRVDCQCQCFTPDRFGRPTIEAHDRYCWRAKALRVFGGPNEVLRQQEASRDLCEQHVKGSGSEFLWMMSAVRLQDCS